MDDISILEAEDEEDGIVAFLGKFGMFRDKVRKVEEIVTKPEFYLNPEKTRQCTSPKARDR